MSHAGALPLHAAEMARFATTLDLAAIRRIVRYPASMKDPDMTDAIARDSNRAQLNEGDSVTLIKDFEGQGHVRDDQARHAGEEHPPHRQSWRDRVQHQAGQGPGAEDRVPEKGVIAPGTQCVTGRPGATP